jgi:hypothetical protein
VTEAVGKTPVDQAVEHALDLFLYAPIGLLFDGGSLLQQLVEKGRNQVSTARVIGRFAVDVGRTEATKAAGRWQDQAAGVLDFLGDSVIGRPAERPSPAAPRPAAKTSPAPPVREVAGATSSPATSSSAASLAIPDYDGLSASQVVNRLAGLTPAELAAVQGYELANRGRKTILSKVAQLQGS